MSSFRAVVLVWTFLLTAASMLHAEGGFKYSYVPKKVYENQLFPVTVIDTRKEKSKPRYQFEISNDIRKNNERTDHQYGCEIIYFDSVEGVVEQDDKIDA